MKYSTRELVTLGVFGALWGGVEISLGSLFHTLSVPMTGMFLSAIGLLVVLVARYFVPRKGSSLFLGVIAALLKMVSLGGIIIWPMIAIMFEALVAEIVLTLFKTNNRWIFVITGALGVFYTLVHPFFSQGVLAGSGMLFVWEMLLQQGSRVFGLPVEAALSVIGIMALVHLVVGAVAGLLAWDVARVVQGRLVPSAAEG